MVTAGIRELKSNLSRYLKMVRAGESILVTDHGRTIARIVQEREPEESEITPQLEKLVAKGQLLLPSRRRESGEPQRCKVDGKSIAAIVSDDRR